jgi:HSP20 family molecular chaperone IbpA
MRNSFLTDRLFDKFWDTTLTPSFNDYDINTSEDGTITLMLKLPGHNNDTVDVELLENQIRVKAIAPDNFKSVVDDIDVKFSVGQGYDGTTASGSIKDGILVIILEKNENKQTKKLKLLNN